MKKSRRWTAFFFFAVGMFVGLCGFFSPGDVIYDDCSRQRETKADCSVLRTSETGAARNVILLIGDGMGIGATFAARVFVQGPEHPLAWEELPFQGLVTTCAIGKITDSAAAATAMATGHKTTVGALSARVFPSYKTFATIVEQIHNQKAVGLVSTTSLWDATPAAFAAHASQRTQAYEIARQMILETRPEVMLGGGAEVFRGGKRRGGVASGRKNLMEAARAGGYTVVQSAAELERLDFNTISRLLGLFAPEGLEYEARRKPDSSEPHLSEMARAALAVLEKDPRGFFLMIEGANIDHAAHATDLELLIGEMVEFNRTVELVLEWANSHPDTLVVITADHETGGIEVVEGEYQPGEMIEVKWRRQIMPGMASHSSQRVPIYAQGPNAGAIREHLDNTEIYCLIRNAFALP